MGSIKPTILYLTDLYYEAKGRAYYEEDIFLSSKLRQDFNVAICHPRDSIALETVVDAIVFRNTGPVIHYLEDYNAFKNRLLAQNAVVYNSLTGQADMQGKQYLVDLTKQGFPVIPSIDSKDDYELLPDSDLYIVKPKNGADSIGMKRLARSELDQVVFQDTLLQPNIDLSYEVSFYYINRDIQYALYAPNKEKRWQLEPYDYTSEDVEFAQQFVEWNALEYGIQRVDACRTRDGQLLLMELEDLNPYLSLLNIEESLRQKFIENFKLSLKAAIASKGNKSEIQ